MQEWMLTNERALCLQITVGTQALPRAVWGPSLEGPQAAPRHSQPRLAIELIPFRYEIL
jgi:hypothetical protein